MPEAVTPPGGTVAAGRGTSRRMRRILLGAGGGCLVLLLFWILAGRPTARLNRLFSGVGLARLPCSARHLRIERQGRLFGTHVLYGRFEADANDIARFVENSPIAGADEPTPMATIAFGPKCPGWMRWEKTVEGRAYHGRAGEASVWLMVDDEARTVYVGVFAHRPAWLRRILD